MRTAQNAHDALLGAWTLRIAHCALDPHAAISKAIFADHSCSRNFSMTWIRSRV
jgi:hypothetical protein